LIHALGARHEQTRSDRDDNVEVKWNNIKSGKERNFYKADTKNNAPYDVSSIMHYRLNVSFICTMLKVWYFYIRLITLKS